jgi:hypothetical protein
MVGSIRGEVTYRGLGPSQSLSLTRRRRSVSARVVDYAVVLKNYLEDLEAEVRAYLEDGWEPAGGVQAIIETGYVGEVRPELQVPKIPLSSSNGPMGGGRWNARESRKCRILRKAARR